MTLANVLDEYKAETKRLLIEREMRHVPLGVDPQEFRTRLEGMMVVTGPMTARLVERPAATLPTDALERWRMLKEHRDAGFLDLGTAAELMDALLK